jgi:hypothetical protein
MTAPVLREMIKYTFRITLLVVGSSIKLNSELKSQVNENKTITEVF